MPKALWSEQAELDLEEFSHFIGFKDRKPITADRIADELARATRKVATPGTTLRPFGRPDIQPFYASLDPVSSGHSSLSKASRGATIVECSADRKEA